VGSISQPPLPNQAKQNKLVRTLPFLVYLFCTFFRLYKSHERQRILAPSAAQIGFELLLARTYPRRVMALSDANARVTEQDRNTLQWHSREQKLHSECIPESVSMAGGYLG